MNYYNENVQDVLKELDTSADQGLDPQEAKARLERYGLNQLKGKKSKPLWLKFLSHFKEFMIIVLIVAAGISFISHEVADGVVILFIVLVNAIFSTAQEAKAEKSIEALQDISAPHSKVMRGGHLEDILSKEVVPGDLLVLEAGDLVPADGRLVEAASLKVEEALLTGESLPVEKQIMPLEDKDLQVAERTNMVFSGTLVTYGRAKYIATATGMETEMGNIASLMMEEKEEMTPLQQKLQEIGKRIGIGVLFIALGVFGLGILQDRDLFDMFFTAVSLAVAAIPEGLPAVVTIVLALGVQRLSKKNAIIRRLPAVETLGSSSIICSDKTGTLTQNKMTVMKVFEEMETKESASKALATAIALCNDAVVEGDKEIGDPTETALLRYALDQDVDFEDLTKSLPRVGEVPFESERKMMSTIHQDDDEYIVFTKGAPDELLERCHKWYGQDGAIPLTEEDRATILSTNTQLGEEALRVLGVAMKKLDTLPQQDSQHVEQDLIFIGLVAMMDPPREEAKKAIEECKRAGIKPIMITGDHKVTATAIATTLGILGPEDEVLTGAELTLMSDEELEKNVHKYAVYARVSPEHKVKIVKAWQKRDQVVAMTGDGVNDAPALRMAEIGTAMGKVGTDVSRNAADLVLMDDNFATIVVAVKEGRGIFQNIRRSIRFLLSCNLGEVFLLVVAMLANMPVPLLPIHILWVNLVTDSFPALALGVEPVADELMKEKPRKKSEGIFTKKLYLLLGLEGTMVGAIALGIFLIGYQYGLEVARTMTFMTIAFVQLSHSVNVRSHGSVLLKTGLFTNKFSLMAIALSAGLQTLVATLPPLQKIFSLVSLSGQQWLMVIGAGLLPFIIVEGIKILRKE